MMGSQLIPFHLNVKTRIQLVHINSGKTGESILVKHN